MKESYNFSESRDQEEFNALPERAKTMMKEGSEQEAREIENLRKNIEADISNQRYGEAGKDALKLVDVMPSFSEEVMRKCLDYIKLDPWRGGSTIETGPSFGNEEETKFYGSREWPLYQEVGELAAILGKTQVAKESVAALYRMERCDMAARVEKILIQRNPELVKQMIKYRLENVHETNNRLEDEEVGVIISLGDDIDFLEDVVKGLVERKMYNIDRVVSFLSEKKLQDNQG